MLPGAQHALIFPLPEKGCSGKAGTRLWNTATITMNLSEVIPWGRSFDEYRLMFGLSESDLAGRFLGCGDGPASFNAEATAQGYSVISCDPIYEFSTEEIEERVEDCYVKVISAVRLNPKGFVWEYFHDPDHLGRARLAAMKTFLSDFEKGKAEGRYIAASLPSLPFGAGQFDIALCSHLLFLYSEQLSFEFHLASIEELLRVALVHRKSVVNANPFARVPHEIKGKPVVAEVFHPGKLRLECR